MSQWNCLNSICVTCNWIASYHPLNLSMVIVGTVKGNHPFLMAMSLKTGGGESLITFVRNLAVDFYYIITLVINVGCSHFSSTSSWQLHSWGIHSSVAFRGVLLTSKFRPVKYGEWADFANWLHYTSIFRLLEPVPLPHTWQLLFTNVWGVVISSIWGDYAK